jgi:hypothetical protein
MISHDSNVRNGDSEMMELVERFTLWKKVSGRFRGECMKVGFPGDRKGSWNISDSVRNEILNGWRACEQGRYAEWRTFSSSYRWSLR